MLYILFIRRRRCCCHYYYCAVRSFILVCLLIERAHTFLIFFSVYFLFPVYFKLSFVAFSVSLAHLKCVLVRVLFRSLSQSLARQTAPNMFNAFSFSNSLCLCLCVCVCLCARELNKSLNQMDKVFRYKSN